jgi:hypothetical protein
VLESLVLESVQSRGSFFLWKSQIGLEESEVGQIDFFGYIINIKGSDCYLAKQGSLGKLPKRPFTPNFFRSLRGCLQPKH